MNKTVLLVEDDEHIQEIIKIHLESLDLEVLTASTGKIGLDYIEKRDDICLYVLDWMLPNLSGLQLCKKIREIKKNNPAILMVTAKVDQDSIVKGLNAGADDYITKPFESEIFKARVRAQLRRSFDKPESSSKISTLGIILDVKAANVTIDGKEVKLTKSEFYLLKTLLSDPGHVFTRQQLISAISGEGIHVNGRTIDTHMVALRKKIHPYNDNINTIRGIGYKFTEKDH